MANRELRSDVWQFFDYQPPSVAGGKDDKAICKDCGSVLSAYGPNGTSHLSRHLGSKSCNRVYIQTYDDLKAKGLVDI